MPTRGTISSAFRTPVAIGLLLLVSGAAHAGRTFRANYSTYPGPGTGWGWWAATADLDGDGHNELLSIRQNSQLTQTVLQVRHGEPGGELASTITTYPLGLRDDQAAYLEPADLDGDGRIDLAVASLDTLVILPGIVGGAFGTPVLIAIPGCLDGGIALGDLNGDGHKDIAVACSNSARVSILWGDGALGFTAGPQFATRPQPADVSVADLNGDHLPDIVVGASQASTILLADGAGGFNSSEVPTAYVSIVADLNRDGIPDLVSEQGVLLGHGDGTFSAPIPHGVGAPAVAADFDEDGILDLAGRGVAGSPAVDQVLVQRGRGDGTFDPAVEYALSGNSFTLTAGDLDGDGHQDLFSSGYDVDATFVMHGLGNGAFERAPSYSTGIPGTVVAAGNLNGDATPDLVVSGRSVRSLAVLRSTGPATYAAPLVYPLPVGQALVRLGDLDGDGRDDVVGATDSSAVISVWLTQSDGSLGARSQFSTPGGVFALKLADLDLDGHLDIVYQCASGTNRVMGQGNGSFGSAVPLGFTLAGDFQVADVNGDGLPDLIGDSGFHNVRVALASAPNVYSGFVDVPGPGPALGAIRIGRRDGDLIPDLLLSAGNIYLYRGLGGGAFGPPSLVAGPTGALKAWVDVDGDGLDDILTLRFESAIVFHNNGDGSFAPGRGFGADRLPATFEVADVDGNGRPDVLAVSPGTVASVSLLLNQTITPNVGVEPGGRAGPRFAVVARPNPASSGIRLTLLGAADTPALIDVLDVAGRVVRQEPVPAFVREVTIGHGAALPSGLYFVRLRRGDESVTTRVCLLRH